MECYTSDFVVIRRKHQEYSSSVRARDDSEDRLRIVESTQAQEFEIDETPDVSPEYEHVRKAFVNFCQFVPKKLLRDLSNVNWSS